MSAAQEESTGSRARGLAARLSEVRRRVEECARRAGREAGAVTLVGVSKTHPASFVAEARAAGLADFGENRVQEAEDKIAEAARLVSSPETAPARWHLIGHLQSNKARRAVKLFDVIHTVDSVELARRLERLCGEEGRDQLPVFVQLSLAGEAAKSGARAEELAGIVEALAACRRVRLAGLMTMPPYSDDPEDARPLFRRLRSLRDEWGARGAFGPEAGGLSMGMSHDFEVAIEEGATLVRVGTAIFGERPAPR
jgi:PLP dependent protein